MNNYTSFPLTHFVHTCSVFTCTRILPGSHSVSRSSPRSTTLVAPSTSQLDLGMQPPITTNQAAQEHRRLFSSRQKNAFMRGADRRTRGSSCGKVKWIPTCTLKFFCLFQANAIKPPTAVKERTALLNASLGDATIQFQMDSSTLECHQQIVSKFPKHPFPLHSATDEGYRRKF